MTKHFLLVQLKRQGFVLIIVMVFVLVFSALAISMATMSGMNVQLASNQHKLNGALASAASGVEVIRFWLSRVAISGTTAPTEFPEPNPDPFASYVISIIDANTDTSLDATFENVRILASTTPKFTGHPTLRGVVFIETPNVVEFAGGANTTAIIVGNGSLEDNSGTNRIIFRGNVNSHPVSDLPNEAKFAGLHDQTGTFPIAPGFHASFGGSFGTLSGAIAGNGVEFFGDAGGTIKGSIINYCDAPMPVSGNSNFYFNRSGTTKVPAGFVPEIMLEYDPTSYSEVVS